MELNEIIESEELHLKHLDELVTESIREEKLLTKKLAELEVDQSITMGQMIADKVAEVGGNWVFICWFGVFLLELSCWQYSLMHNDDRSFNFFQ